MTEPKKKATGTSKKEIRIKIQDYVNAAVGALHLAQPSRKVTKAIKEASKKIAAEVASNLKKIGKESSKKKSVKKAKH